MRTRIWPAPILPIVAGLGLAVSGCRVGPQYVRPSVPMAPDFKEAPPESFKSVDGWKPAQPGDAKVKGDWWTLFNDPKLNALEAQIDPANQTLKEAEANFRAARSGALQQGVAGADHRSRARHRCGSRVQPSTVLERFRSQSG